MSKFFILISTFSIFLSSAQNSQGRFISDVSSGCQVWSENFSPDDSVSWSGACEANFAQGFGTLNWYQKQKIVATYVGEMNQGNPNGKGKYTIDGFAILEGNFVDGNLNGLGKADYSASFGQIHLGHFRNGMLNGKGEIKFKDGTRNKGYFIDGNRLDLDKSYLTSLTKNQSSIIDKTNIYLGDGESNALFYYTIAPQHTEAVLVLFPSAFESAENVINCNKDLIQKAHDNKIMTVVVSANFNASLSKDPLALEFVNTTFLELTKKYQVPSEKFILSGFSLGGMNAIRYTEMSRDEKFTTSIKPLAVIGVDPPVDEIGLYYRASDEIKSYESDSLNLDQGRKNALEEARMIVDHWQELYGGSPDQVRKQFVTNSPFTRTELDGGNAKFLVDTPIRIYSDPDIEWHLKNRNRDYYHINAADQSAMINFLQSKGNVNAAFVSALGKGFRLDGSRHPHAWSIVDAAECIAWIKSLL